MRKSNLHSQILVILGLFLLSSFKQSFLSPMGHFANHHDHVKLKENKPPVSVLCPIRKELKEIKERSVGPKAPLMLSQKKRELRKIVEEVALETGAPAELLHAICEVESNSNVKAFKRNDGGRTNHAFGVCQVLRRTGEMVLGKKMNGCRKNYRWTKHSQRTKEACPLFDPHTNVTAAALYLVKQMNRYETLEDLIASYNAGSIRKNKKTGDYINRRYIDKVLFALHKQNQSYFQLTSS